MSKKLSRKRHRLWRQNPRCHYCGVETIYLPCHIKNITYNEHTRNRLATIDHVRPRHHPDRQKRPQHGDVLHVLSCWKCNNERDQRELAEKPKEWLCEQSGARPLIQRDITELETILSKLEWKGELVYPIARWNRRRKQWDYPRAWAKTKRSQAAVLWAWFEKGMDGEDQDLQEGVGILEAREAQGHAYHLNPAEQGTSQAAYL